MSETALDGAIRIKEVSHLGMISLRGDFSDSAFSDAIRESTGATIPETRRMTRNGDNALLWMSPDELLAVVDDAKVDQIAGQLTTKLSKTHSLCVNVSDARAVYHLSGTGWREVLAKGAPVDLRSEAFGPGDVRRTRLGQVAAAFWCEEAESAHLICFRSVAEFVFDWLKLAAAPGTLPDFLTNE